MDLYYRWTDGFTWFAYEWWDAGADYELRKAVMLEF